MTKRAEHGGPRIIVIHGLAQARAAAAAARALGVPVRLRSGRGAAAYAGALWFREIVTDVRAGFAEVAIEASLDCADQAGLALGALRQGIEMIRFDGPARVAAKLSAVAATYGATLDTDRRAVLDLEGLASDETEAACLDWLK